MEDVNTVGQDRREEEIGGEREKKNEVDGDVERDSLHGGGGKQEAKKEKKKKNKEEDQDGEGDKEKNKEKKKKTKEKPQDAAGGLRQKLAKIEAKMEALRVKQDGILKLLQQAESGEGSNKADDEKN